MFFSDSEADPAYRPHVVPEDETISIPVGIEADPSFSKRKRPSNLVQFIVHLSGKALAYNSCRAASFSRRIVSTIDQHTEKRHLPILPNPENEMRHAHLIV